MCCSLPIDTIRLHKSDFGRACIHTEYLELRYVGYDHVLVATNRYSRRELTRHGVSYSYPDAPSCKDNDKCGGLQ
ncbi:hypothetical protein EVB79_003 [Rhizobium phage RHph_N3_13]|nr:hypothetical protein EVB79_003 [Rhizobium phage RHph_N3_13]QIG69830.1 hypothetical protein F67_I3_11_004 [Rhizobium phage RHph_I3_11]